MARNSLIQGNSTANAANYKTVSITPGANRLVLAFVMNVRGTATQPAVAPTASGNNLTWVQVATVQIAGAPNRRLTCFRATGPAPAAGELTFDFGAEQQADCAWSVFEYDGVDTSGVVQTKTLSGGAILSITLDPLADPATSVVVGGLISAPLFGFPAPIQPGAGMTQIHEQNVAEPGTGGSLQTEDRIGGTAPVTWASVGGLGVAAIALELKAGVSIAEALELSKRFEPILFFHPEEKFLPANAKRYIEKCALWKAEAPFDAKDSFGGKGAPFPRSPLIAKGSIAAIKTEPGTFLGDSLVESPVETRFLELGGWKDTTGMAEPDVTATSNNIFANRDTIADQYKTGGALEDSTLWYHAEFLDNAKLRRLLSTVSAPELAKVLDSPRLKNPALMCYYFFFPAHDQPLQASCTFPGSKDYAGFGGEWACVALLLEQDDKPGAPPGPSDQPFRASFIGQTGCALFPTPGVSLPPQAEDDQDFARRIVMKVNRISDATTIGDHPELFLANGSHSLYLQSGTVAVTYAGNRSYICGYEYLPPVSAGGGGGDGPSDPALIFLLKILAGTILDSAVGLFAGWIWAIPEGVAPSAGLDIVGLPVVYDEPAPDQVAPARNSNFVHPENVTVPDGGTDLGNWRSAQGVSVGGRNYDCIVDREAQTWWPNETQGGGYRGLWGPCVEKNLFTRRSGMRFPSFWKMFFLAFATGVTEGKF